MNKSENLTSETSTVVVYPIVSALLKAMDYLEHSTEWEPINEVQKKFMKEVFDWCRGDAHRIEEIRSIAHSDVFVLNKWLKENGFSIQLDPFGGDGFGVVSILDVVGEWLSSGSQNHVFDDDRQKYPGVKIQSDYAFHSVEDHDSFIVELKTKGDDLVYLMMLEEVPEGIEIIKLVERLTNEMKPIHVQHNGVIFPMVDLDIEKEVDWLLGMRLLTPDGPVPYYFIAQALQQTKLKMNEKGFRVKSAAAIGMLAKGMPPKVTPYVINRPFLMWISRPNLSKPLFVGYLNKDVWKDPGGLEM